MNNIDIKISYSDRHTINKAVNRYIKDLRGENYQALNYHGQNSPLFSSWHKPKIADTVLNGYD